MKDKILELKGLPSGSCGQILAIREDGTGLEWRDMAPEEKEFFDRHGDLIGRRDRLEGLFDGKDW